MKSRVRSENKMKIFFRCYVIVHAVHFTTTTVQIEAQYLYEVLALLIALLLFALMLLLWSQARLLELFNNDDLNLQKRPLAPRNSGISAAYQIFNSNYSNISLRDFGSKLKFKSLEEKKVQVSSRGNLKCNEFVVGLPSPSPEVPTSFHTNVQNG